MRKKMLSDARQQKLISGLSRRITKLQGQTQSTIEAFEKHRHEIRDRFQKESITFEAEQRRKSQQATTSWDIAREQSFIAADRQTWSSIQKEQRVLKELGERFKLQTSQDKKAYEESQATLTRQYEERKPKPAQSLEKLVLALGSKQRETNEVLDDFRTLVLSRNLSIPTYSDSDLATELTKSPTTTAGWESIQALATRIKDLDERVRKTSIVRFSGSIAPWLIGVVPAILIGWFIFKNQPEPFWLGPSVGLGLAILLPLITILAMMSRMKRTMLGPYREMMQTFWAIQKKSDEVRSLAEKNCKAEQARLLSEYLSKQKQLASDYQSLCQKLEQTYATDRSTLATEQAALRTSAATALDEKLNEVDRLQTPIFGRLQDSIRISTQQREAEFKNTLQESLQEQTRQIDRLSLRARQGTIAANHRIDQDQAIIANTFPKWDAPIWLSSKWNRDAKTTSFPIGQMHVALRGESDSPSSDEVVSQTIHDDAHHVLGQSTTQGNSPQVDSLHLSTPVCYDVMKHGTLSVVANREHREQASLVIQQLLARGVTSLPMGSLHMTIIDPEGLGRDFGWLMPLADADPRLVTHRVWTQSSQIAQQLSLLAYQNEEIIQQRLRDRYVDLIDYNADAGPMAEPFRWIVWLNFPFGLDEQSWKSLCTLFVSGPRSGIGVLLTIDPTQVWPAFADKSKVFGQGLTIEIKNHDTQTNSDPDSSPPTVAVGFFSDSVRSKYPIELAAPPASDRLATIIESCKEDALKAGRIEVPFAQIATKQSEIGLSKSSDGLIVPLGIAGVGRTQMMRLGLGTAQHVLVAGKTGSGKSSLLHTLITSAALQYGPDELRFVLMDFKKGVEFQVYAHAAMPHADIIGIESRREFGLSALEYLDRVMTTRGEMFRDCGVQDVPSWCRIKPNEAMPRVLVVIDEFQEMFVEDDKLAQKSAMLLDRIVRQGRSFGIHMVMASQTLGGSYSLPRTTLAQMAVRIALQCDGADAMLILGEDNMAASRLRHSGQAIYNDAGGRVESNQPFQVAYLSSQNHGAVLESINESVLNCYSSLRLPDPSTTTLGRQIVFEGHRPALWNEFDVERGWKSLENKDPQALSMVLGESLSIEPTIVKTLARQSGRNVAVVGSDDAIVANLVSSVWRGWYEQTDPARVPQICFLDGSRAEDRFAAELRPSFQKHFTPTSIEQVGDLSKPIDDAHLYSDYRHCDAMLEWLAGELERRLANPDQPHRSFCFFVVNLGRFRELRRNDDFSFGSSMDTAAKPTAEATFTKLLREGPPLGLHTVVCSDSAGNLGRWIPRQGMRDLEVRILCQMSNNDSNTLIDSGAANRLEPHAVIYYDEIDGKILKVRPYRMDS
jgi:DNA segregation ATPase FtsK/SpoIIIE, S-DNA-T family